MNLSDTILNDDRLTAKIAGRASDLFNQHLRKIFVSTDKLFSVLLTMEWIGAIVTSITVSPLAWEGMNASMHLHVQLAVWLGFSIIALPLYLAWKFPGHVATRHCIAIAQALITSLLIHLTGGRIETHFLVFGSLTFLFFYRDWRVLITASVLVAIDHLLRGYFIPYSVYGVTYREPLRWLEHASWVVFADLFLIRACILSRREMWHVAQKRAQLELVNEIFESEVVLRTKEVKQSEERFRGLCTSVPTVIFQSDSDGGWEVVGDRWQELTGVSASRASKWWTLAPDNDQKSLRESWDEALRDGTEWHEEFCIITPNSGFRWVRGKAVKCEHEGDTPLYIGTLEDISDSKQMEEKSRRLLLLQQREDFLAMLANDLKNPIVGANRVLELLSDGKLGELNDAQTEVMMRLMDGNKELLQMIQNITSVYRYEKESNNLKFEPTNLATIARDCMNDVRPQAAERKIELNLEITDDEKLNIVADPSSIRRVISNLLDNALKFTPDNQSISLRSFVQKGKVMIEVFNAGSHIDYEDQTKLFKRPLTGIEGKRYLPRAGLGLYLCRQIVEAHKGAISCSSEKDVGTTFTVSLPRRSRTAEQSVLTTV